MKCIEHIKDIALDCKYRPTKGLKHRVLVIPYKDIDRRYTAMNEDKSVITHFQLYPTKRGYLFELSKAFKVNGSQKLSGGFVHELSIKIDKANSDNIATMNALTKGTYVLIVETMSNTFEILGYDAGVVMSSIQRDYASNVIGLTFATPSDVKELRMVALWGEGDYIAMSRKVERKMFVGKNLILNSKPRITQAFSVYGWVNSYNLSHKLEIGATYILTFKNYKTEVPFFFLWLGSWDTAQEIKAGVAFTAKREYSLLFTHTKQVPFESDFELLKLEKGNTSTDWCPANED